jgi:hypothetical protein
MQALKEYVANKNQWNSIFGIAPLDLNDAMDRQQIAQSIDSELSPENLHCDGEISIAQAERKRQKLNKVCAQLLKLDPSVNHQLGEYYP